MEALQDTKTVAEVSPELTSESYPSRSRVKISSTANIPLPGCIRCGASVLVRLFTMTVALWADWCSRQVHRKLSFCRGQMTLFAQSLKLLLEENRKCCHRSGADLLTLSSQQPLPTHKQRWAKWSWALGWGSSVFVCVDPCLVCKCLCPILDKGNMRSGVRNMSTIYTLMDYCENVHVEQSCCQCI